MTEKTYHATVQSTLMQHCNSTVRFIPDNLYVDINKPKIALYRQG